MGLWAQTSTTRKRKEKSLAVFLLLLGEEGHQPDSRKWVPLTTLTDPQGGNRIKKRRVASRGCSLGTKALRKGPGLCFPAPVNGRRPRVHALNSLAGDSYKHPEGGATLTLW